MKRQPKVSILMLNWNGIDFTRRCFDSLLKTTYPNFEILLLDNGSVDQEADILQKEFKKYKKIKIYKNPKNVGYAAGMNKLYTHATGELVMFINNDMEFTPRWLTILVEALQRNPEVGAVQPKVKDLKARDRFEYAAAGGGYIDIFGYPFARGRIFSSVEKDKGQYDNEVIVSWTGVFLTTKEILKKTGLFDPIFFNYAEDVDLCFRIYGQGYKILYVPDSIVYHFGGGVLGKNQGKRMVFIHRNHLILMLKDWETKTLILLFGPRVLMDVLAFFYYLFTGYLSSAAAVIKAYMSLFTMIPHIYKARKETQKKILPKNRSLQPIYKGSIVWDYFIGDKKTFVDIFKSKNFPHR